MTIENLDERPNPYDWPMAVDPPLSSYEIRDLKNAVRDLTSEMRQQRTENIATFVQKIEVNSLVDDRIKESPTIEALTKAIEGLQGAQVWLTRAFVGAVFSLIVGVVIFFVTHKS